jgi:hypothetical protein
MRENEIMRIMELQFVLSYLGHISKEDSDNMTLFELKQWYEMLKKQRKLEQDQEIANSKK